MSIYGGVTAFACSLVLWASPCATAGIVLPGGIDGIIKSELPLNEWSPSNTFNSEATTLSGGVIHTHNWAKTNVALPITANTYEPKPLSIMNDSPLGGIFSDIFKSFSFIIGPIAKWLTPYVSDFKDFKFFQWPQFNGLSFHSLLKDLFFYPPNWEYKYAAPEVRPDPEPVTNSMYQSIPGPGGLVVLLGGFVFARRRKRC